MPPRIPIRTSARIGNQAEGLADGPESAPEEGSRVDVLPTDPHRQVSRLRPVCQTGTADDGPSLHGGADRHQHLGEVRDRDLHLPALDGDRSHPRHGSGEGNPTCDGCLHRRARCCSQVDSPVPGVETRRGERIDRLSGDRGQKAHEPNRHPHVSAPPISRPRRAGLSPSYRIGADGGRGSKVGATRH